MKNRLGKFFSASVTVGPTVLWLILFVLIPLFFVLFISVMEKSTYGGVEMNASLQGFRDAATVSNLKIFGESLWLSFKTTIICLLVGYPFAWVIAKSSPKVKPILVVLLMVPFWVNSIIRLYGWNILLSNGGVVNRLLMDWGLIERPLTMMLTEGAVLLGMVYDLLPFTVLPLYTSIEKLDHSLVEAARDLGANGYRAFLRVIFPQTMPGIFAGTVQTFIPSLGLFYISDMMGGGTTVYIGNLIKNLFIGGRNWPAGAALAVGLILITLFMMKCYTKAGGNLEDMA